MTSWKIGAVSVTRVEEQIGFASFPAEQFFVGFEREVMQRHLAWLVPDHYAPEHDKLVTSVHSWLIRTPRHTILLDCCGGNHKQRPGFARFHQRDTPYLARLRAVFLVIDEALIGKLADGLRRGARRDADAFGQHLGADLFQRPLLGIPDDLQVVLGNRTEPNGLLGR